MRNDFYFTANTKFEVLLSPINYISITSYGIEALFRVIMHTNRLPNEKFSPLIFVEI